MCILYTRSEFNSYQSIIWGCSSVGRAPPLHGGGRRFDSCQLHKATMASWQKSNASDCKSDLCRCESYRRLNAILAQLVEQLICNQQVVSSNLTDGSNKKGELSFPFFYVLYRRKYKTIPCPTYEINPLTPTKRLIQRSQIRRMC